jgi:7,8-dihydropterin-6-yl-methyl-4-(beta-D-ribofuranosyl)aminobenzene 5'-phosphate synthase
MMTMANLNPRTMPIFSRRWWPFLGFSAPAVLALLYRLNRRYTRNCARQVPLNEERIQRATPLDLPELEFLELTVLVEQEVRPGFRGDPGVSYLLTTDRGSLLFDVGFGPDQPTLWHNCRELGVSLDDVDQLVISHLHPDHMGGMKASLRKTVSLPRELGAPRGQPCYLPDKARAPGFSSRVVEGPQMVGAGLGSTGPLARSLFFMGWTEEQALVASLRGKGLVLLTGCGHPTLEILLRMAGRLSDAPLYAVVGGLHLPVTESPMKTAGIQMQMLMGTGKPPWQPIDEKDLYRTINTINQAGPRRVYLSAHDMCPYAVDRIDRDVGAKVEVLRAGQRYQI